MVAAIISLRPSLPPVSDELRKRVQSIRVRSIPDTPGSRVNSLQQSQQTQDRGNWRNKQTPVISSQKLQNGGNWRNSSNSLNNSGSSTPVSPTPFRFSNSERSPKPNQPSTPDSSSTPKPVSPWTGGTRYVSKFHNGSKAGDDKILKTIILNKLNVFSVKTYDDVKQFLFQILGSDQKEFIREFTWMVFRKAAAEDKFCGLYAKLLSEIKREYPVILEEMKKLHMTYLDIWKITDSPDSLVDKRYRFGYSQFLAELTALGVIEIETMMITLETLKASIMECITKKEQMETIDEYMNCLKQLCNSKTPVALKKMMNGLLVTDLNFLIQTPSEKVPGLSSRSRFACMDIIDLLKTR
uniref:MIF4G domain-containing protein n=1 Tax=viral metagenome TaxID=1070528 RepID=A0A6C0ANG9_9ZZZZ